MIDTDRYNSCTYVKMSDTELHCVRNNSVQWGTKTQRVRLSPFCRHNCKPYWRKPISKSFNQAHKFWHIYAKWPSTTKPSTVPKFKQTPPHHVQKISQTCTCSSLCRLHIQCMSVRLSIGPRFGVKAFGRCLVWISAGSWYTVMAAALFYLY